MIGVLHKVGLVLHSIVQVPYMVLYGAQNRSVILWELLKNHENINKKLHFLNFGHSIYIFMQKSSALTPSRQRVSLFAGAQSSPPWKMLVVFGV